MLVASRPGSTPLRPDRSLANDPPVAYQEATIDSRSVTTVCVVESRDKYVSAPLHACGLVGHDAQLTLSANCWPALTVIGCTPDPSAGTTVAGPEPEVLDSDAIAGLTFGT